MRTPTPTTVDQITAEKMKISERLARLDVDRTRIATQFADLEAAERVLTRVSKAPLGRRPRSASAAEAKAAITPRGRGRPSRPATAKSAKPSSSASVPTLLMLTLALLIALGALAAPGMALACLTNAAMTRPDSRQNPTRTLRGLSQGSPKPCRHRGAAPYPRRKDPGARWETLCDTLTPCHEETGCASLWILRWGSMVRSPFAPAKSQQRTGASSIAEVPPAESAVEQFLLGSNAQEPVVCRLHAGGSSQERTRLCWGFPC